MGHRAKNKQGSPEPLEPKPWSTAKKTGKRKALGDAVDNKRPAKKVKGAKESAKSTVMAKVKSMGTGAKAHLSKVKAKVKLHSPPIDAESADGWEDVEDGADLKA
jgi:hypothetical protein